MNLAWRSSSSSSFEYLCSKARVWRKTVFAGTGRRESYVGASMPRPVLRAICTWRAKPGPRLRRIERSLFDGVERNGGVSLNSQPQTTRSISQRPRETQGEHRPLSRKKSKVSALRPCLVYISRDDSISNKMNVRGPFKPIHSAFN